MLIAIPTGVKVLELERDAWSAGGSGLNTPMLFCVACLVQFLCGGLTGISHAIAPLDWQTKNSYYLVAHFHFVVRRRDRLRDPRRRCTTGFRR